MAHTKAKGTTKLGRDSESKRLGVKIYGGSPIRNGQIIIRQRGTKYTPGIGVRKGGDDTLYAIRDGVVLFKQTRVASFNGNKMVRQNVMVVDAPAKEAKKTAKPEVTEEKEAQVKE